MIELSYERRVYFDYVDIGVFGDDAASMAREDNAHRELAKFIAFQPEHNAPAPLPEELLA